MKELTDISDIQYPSEIKFADTVEITTYTWGRYDIILNQYFGGDTNYLPILLDINSIANPFSIPMGSVFYVPDVNFVNTELKKVNLFEPDSKIPGVSNSMKCLEVNRQNLKNKKNHITTGIPKLNVAVRNVEFDESTGTISY